ncbi:MAG: CHAT domain-containing protein [Prevotella sp.]|nr:CHAT domain-containing protein [Prevotella sp.]
MQRIIFLFFIFLSSASLYSQTEEQLIGWYQQSDSAAKHGNYQEAIRLLELYKEGYGKLHSQNDINYATNILYSLARYYFFLGKYDKAVELGKQRVEILKELLKENDSDYASALVTLADYYYQNADYKEAVDICTKAMEIRKDILGENHALYAQCLSNLALYISHLGDYHKSLIFGTEALDIFTLEESAQSKYNSAVTINNLALCYSNLGDYKKAIELGSNAIILLKELFVKYGYVYEIINKAIEMYPISNDNLGTFWWNYAYELWKQELFSTSWYDGEWSKIFSRAACVEALYNNNQAIEFYNEELLTRYGEKHPIYATFLANRANYLLLYGFVAEDEEEAISSITSALELATKAMSIRREILGNNHPLYASSLTQIVTLNYFLDDYSQALHYFSENISIIQSHILKQFSGITSEQRSMYWEKYINQFTDFYPFFTYRSNATTAPDLYDKSALFAKGLLLSTDIEMNRLIQGSGDEDALRMFEVLRNNRLLLQRLKETPIEKRPINSDSLATVVKNLEQALMKISNANGDFTQKLRITWQDVQQALEPDEIAIEFLSFPVYYSDSTMVAALTLRKDDKEPKFIPLFEQRQLQELNDTKFYYCPDQTTLVWQPLQQELQGIRRIYFSPSGVLHNIGIEYSPGMEEFDIYRLSSTREVIDLKERGEGIMATTPIHTKGEKRNAVLYGGVDYDVVISDYTHKEGTGDISVALHHAFIDSLGIRGAKAKIPYLPYTLDEVKGIKELFDKKKQEAYAITGKDATETSVKQLSAHRPRILHIATHGFYWKEEEADYWKRQESFLFLGLEDSRSAAELENKALTRSGLFMAGVNELKGQDLPMEADDGVLTAQEISYLDLRGINLVVLSACQTGLGDINQGEGVFGLQRGFKKAGVQTLVMSLWEVDDNATQILMTTFYDNLLQGQSKHEAFHNAQQHLQIVDNGKYNDPQYWAAFILLD